LKGYDCSAICIQEGGLAPASSAGEPRPRVEGEVWRGIPAERPRGKARLSDRPEFSCVPGIELNDDDLREKRPGTGNSCGKRSRDTSGINETSFPNSGSSSAFLSRPYRLSMRMPRTRSTIGSLSSRAKGRSNETLNVVWRQVGLVQVFIHIDANPNPSKLKCRYAQNDRLCTH
jgi:hypothetical protein